MHHLDGVLVARHASSEQEALVEGRTGEGGHKRTHIRTARWSQLDDKRRHGRLEDGAPAEAVIVHHQCVLHVIVLHVHCPDVRDCKWAVLHVIARRCVSSRSVAQQDLAPCLPYIHYLP